MKNKIKLDVQLRADQKLDTAEIMAVFKAVGWAKEPDKIEKAFKNSYNISARHKGRLIGFARAVTDQEYYTNIHDVIVVPGYQRKGIARRMIRMIMERFRGTYFFLTHTPGTREFYRKCGFQYNRNALWIPK